MVLECEGLADYTMSSDALNCSDSSQLKYCEIRNNLTGRVVLYENVTIDGLLGSELQDPIIKSECEVEYNITIKQTNDDENQM